MPIPANGAMYFEQYVIVSDGTNLRDACSATTGLQFVHTPSVDGAGRRLLPPLWVRKYGSV